MLGSDDMIAVAPPDHPVARRSVITWAELAAHPIVALAPGSGLRRRADLAWQQSGATPRVPVAAETVATVIGMVAAGLGVTALTRSVLQLSPGTTVKTTPLIAPRVSRSLAVVVRANPSLPPPAEAFLKVLERVRFDPKDEQAPTGQD